MVVLPPKDCNPKVGRVELEIEKQQDTVNKYCAKDGDEFVSNGKRYIRTISSDGIRDILIPNKGQNANAIIFCQDEYDKVGNKTNVLTVEEKKQLLEEYKKNRDYLSDESFKRKQALRMYAQNKEYVPGLSDLEIELRKIKNYVVDRAHDLKQEDEEEIKLCNKLIMSTQCQAIRDAQIAEKKLIQKEILLAQKEFEEKMEEDRVEALKKFEEARQKDLEKKRQFVAAIKEQVKENELQQKIEFEETQEQARLANEAAMHIKLEELNAFKRKLENQAKLRDEMRQVNLQLHYIHDIEREEQRLLDEQMRENMRRKAEEEEKWEEEMKKQAREKEKEIAAVRALQQRAHDTQALQDAINATRIQEEKEREWRKREKQRVIQRIQDEMNLAKVREAQIRHRQMHQAIGIEMERQEVQKNANVSQLEMRKRKEEELKRLKIRDEFRMDLLKQINEKEKERLKERQEKFEEGLAIRLEEQNRNIGLKKTMAKKVAGLREHHLPEKYLKEIERQLKLVD